MEDPGGRTPATLVADLKARVIALSKRGVKAISINSWARVVNAYLHWLHEEGHLTKRLSLPRLKEPKTVIVPLRADDIRSLIEYKVKRLGEKAYTPLR